MSKELDIVYKDSTRSYHTVAKWVAEFKNTECGLEDAPRMGSPSTITTGNNIEAVEQILIRDRQISARRVADKLSILETIIHEIINNQLGMKKVYTGCEYWNCWHQFNVPIVWIVVKSSLKRVK